ncbi:hypothetical protein RB597_007041 [Gaeumannomyces tritici]
MKCFTNYIPVFLVALLPPFALALPADLPYQNGNLPRQASSRDSGTGNGAQNSILGPGSPRNSSNPGNPGNPGSPVTAQQQRNAVSAWQSDTGKVSHFLNTATTFTGQEYTQQAQIALDAELDELLHKKVLDQALGGQPSVRAASNVLETQGFFQQVVDVLAAWSATAPPRPRATSTSSTATAASTSCPTSTPTSPPPASPRPGPSAPPPAPRCRAPPRTPRALVGCLLHRRPPAPPPCRHRRRRRRSLR